MAASKYCKLHGLKGVEELAEYTELKKRRLFDWWNTNNKAFKTLVAGWESDMLNKAVKGISR